VCRQQLEYHVGQPEGDQGAGQQQRRDERLVVGLGGVLVTVVRETAGGDAGGGRRAQPTSVGRAQFDGATTALQHLRGNETMHSRPFTQLN